MLVSLVDHDELVELAALERDLGEELRQHHEDAEGLILLHDAELDDHEPTGAEDLTEVARPAVRPARGGAARELPRARAGAGWRAPISAAR